MSADAPPGASTGEIWLDLPAGMRQFCPHRAPVVQEGPSVVAAALRQHECPLRQQPGFRGEAAVTAGYA